MLKVNLKKLSQDARLPVKGHEGDFCYDVWAVSEEEIAPNVWRYGLGFKYEIERKRLEEFVTYPRGEKQVTYYNLNNFELAIGLKPRSSIWETGMQLANSEGTLDEFYRGEAKAVFYHLMPNMPRYHKGDKIGQIYVKIAPKIEFSFVDEINENTERGDGGFGSTGKK